MRTNEGKRVGHKLATKTNKKNYLNKWEGPSWITMLNEILKLSEKLGIRKRMPSNKRLFFIERFTFLPTQLECAHACTLTDIHIYMQSS